MSDKVRREKEEQYFLKKEMELRDKIKHRLQEQAHVARLKGEFGEADERVLLAFEEAGFSRETMVLLHLVPLLEVAWADGSVSAAEREQILAIARIRNIVPGTPAYEMLDRGLTHGLKPEMYDACRRAIRIIFETLPADEQQKLEGTLRDACLGVAAASGGFLGLGNRVSSEEQAAIDRLAKTFEEAHAASAKEVHGKI